jgi:hypothetical protein
MAYVFFILMVSLWLAFAAVLVTAPTRLDGTWHTVRALPLAVEGVVWLVFLPWMVGLAVWERRWTLPARLLLVAVLAIGWTLVAFPRGG